MSNHPLMGTGENRLVSNFAPFLPIFAPFFKGKFLSNLAQKFLPNLAPFLPKLAPFGRTISCPILHLFCLILHLFIAKKGAKMGKKDKDGLDFPLKKMCIDLEHMRVSKNVHSNLPLVTYP